MQDSTPAPVESGRSERVLPDSLARYTDAALYGLVAGAALCLFALFTNPVPDPSFPWATLPASLRLPFRQPRIEHWPVTYTAGIWLWIVGFPGLFLKGYERYSAARRISPMAWLVGLPTGAMFAWTTYCRFFWPKLHPPTWNAPSYTFVCWLYCSSYHPIWSDLAYAVATLGALSILLDTRYRWATKYAITVFGVLSLPLGLPALYEAHRRDTNQATESGEVARE
ncbi:hypothetical protein [Halocalculus aciditolerans]|uniref:Uncharacterized protein n=1 Tax=Halocalculus aciditolerans TaxID=1383812 RepID=A0A830FHD6_9EURY|nr:hypothetical protein [Halocalculus aciditolerans]GGL52874.1 hypothetical protein GCM10009039_08860 [Halocalculus aciditolerans]